MIVGTLLMGLLAAPPAQVIILSKYRPTELKILTGKCSIRGKRVDKLRVEAEDLKACRSGRCRTVPSPSKLSCRRAAKLQVNGIKPRTYGRAFIVAAKSKRLRIIAAVDEDRYVQGVLNSELSGAPESAKRAQAILARTYLRYAQEQPRHRDAPVCDLTHCQVYRPPARLKLDDRRVLTHKDGSPSPVFFHSTCGGHTTDANKVWRGSGAALVGIRDFNPKTQQAWCASSPHYRWITELTAKGMQSHLHALVGHKLDRASLVFSRRDTSGLQWRVGDRNRTQTISGRKVHRQLARSLGWGVIKSSRFKAIRAGDSYRLHGEGLGHGVGLCQTGAMARSKAGQSTEQILKAYFPQLRLSQ